VIEPISGSAEASAENPAVRDSGDPGPWSRG
jgi:hypothetical protein